MKIQPGPKDKTYGQNIVGDSYLGNIPNKGQPILNNANINQNYYQQNQSYLYQNPNPYQNNQQFQQNIYQDEHSIMMVPTVDLAHCKYPVQMKCPYCSQFIMTYIDRRIGDGTIIMSVILLFLCWPIFWIPCVLQECKDRAHICPQCQHLVGVKKYEICS